MQFLFAKDKYSATGNIPNLMDRTKPILYHLFYQNNSKGIANDKNPIKKKY